MLRICWRQVGFHRELLQKLCVALGTEGLSQDGLGVRLWEGTQELLRIKRVLERNVETPVNMESASFTPKL